MGQRFPNQQQQQQFYPGYQQPQQPQMAPTPNQQGPINPNDLSLIQNRYVMKCFFAAKEYI